MRIKSLYGCISGEGYEPFTAEAAREFGYLAGDLAAILEKVRSIEVIDGESVPVAEKAVVTGKTQTERVELTYQVDGETKTRTYSRAEILAF